MPINGRSLLAVLVFGALGLLGCAPENSAGDRPLGAPHAGHAHSAKNGGTLFPVAGGNVELVFDGVTGRVDAYLWDGCVEAAVRSAQPSLLVLATREGREVALDLLPVEDPLTGERTGATSHFSSASGDLVGAARLEGRVPPFSFRGGTAEVASFLITARRVADR